MSTRLILMAGDISGDTVAARLAAAAAAFWGAPLPWEARIGLDFEAARLARAGFDVVPPADDRTPLVAIKTMGNIAIENIAIATIDADLLLAALARAPFTLSIIALPGTVNGAFVKTALTALAARQTLGTLTLPAAEIAAFPGNFLAKSRYAALSFRPLGAAHAPPWNGTHEQRGLFETP
jgi:hypothetical protein